MSERRRARRGDELILAEKALRKCALGYPEAYEEFPWGERAIKVRKKIFLFMGAGERGLSLSTKLPESGPAALMMPFAEPTHYGLGKSGWVTAHFTQAQKPPIDLLRGWIDESYRAVAPRKLAAGLDAAASHEPHRAPARERRAAGPPRRRNRG